MKLIHFFALIASVFCFAQQPVIYDAYPEHQDYYKGGSAAFYKELRDVILKRNMQPCENKHEEYQISVLIKENAEISFVKDFDTIAISKKKCAYDMIRKALPYLENWKPATIEQKNINAIQKIKFNPNDLFSNYNEDYSDPDDNLTIPEYPGGINKFRQDVINNINFHHLNPSDDFDMKAIVEFIINTEGNIENIDVISNNNNFKNMTKVAVRKTNQKWTPAIKNGMIIRYRMRLPISMKARTE
ncbi:MAG: energy transducer TonB [Bacteroidetes bacterium]|jgi:hypothetical protein|nr:energy transducer TonB [Bacteroidota bacterium]